MRIPREVYVFGSGGHGKVVATVLQSRKIKVRGFLDEDPGKRGVKILGLPVLGGFDYLDNRRKKIRSIGVIAAIGNNAARARIFGSLKEKGYLLVAAAHSSSVIHKSVEIGDGTVVMPGVVVNADSRIGEDVIVNSSSSIDHDCIIGHHVHLAPGVVIAGGVTVGDGAFLGVGVCIIPGVRIGVDAVIGAGAVVLDDVPARCKVAGVPARELGVR